MSKLTFAHGAGALVVNTGHYHVEFVLRPIGVERLPWKSLSIGLIFAMGFATLVALLANMTLLPVLLVKCRGEGHRYQQ